MYNICIGRSPHSVTRIAIAPIIRSQAVETTMNNISIPQRINRLLPDQQIEAILRTLLINRPVRILKTLVRTGRNQISWIYIENEITGDRTATFVSFADLLEAFWTWLESAQLMLMALWQRETVAKAIWQNTDVGTKVYHRNFGWCEVVGKDLTERLGIPRFWVETSDSLEIVNAIEVVSK
ncbi:MAG: hypothetical protein QNJ72_31305 [Pleurocapsa sp. MO_226.B13]|nr:hypothetical protein [Pleurocapsa sp. MO_226.B13]